MKKHFLHFLSLILWMSFCYACSNDNQNIKKQDLSNNSKKIDSDYHKNNFDSLIMVIDKEIGPKLDYGEELLPSIEFLDIYEHSSVYLEDAIRFISKEQFKYQQAAVCIFA